MSTLSFLQEYSDKEYKGTSFSSNARAKNRADELFLRSEEKLLRFYVVTNTVYDAVSCVVFFFVNLNFFESVFPHFKHTQRIKNGEKEGLWQCEKERERDERIRECKRGSVLGGEIVVSSLERVGVASQGCVCVARASEIE